MKELFQNDEAFEAVIRQQDRLNTLFPSLSDKTAKLSHRITSQAIYRLDNNLKSIEWNDIDPINHIPTPLQWAFAVVRSRCIQVRNDWFGLLPVIDIANHSLNPNAELNMIVKSENVSPQDISDEVICLCASRDLEEGEEITISYGEVNTVVVLYIFIFILLIFNNNLQLLSYYELYF